MIRKRLLAAGMVVGLVATACGGTTPSASTQPSTGASQPAASGGEQSAAPSTKLAAQQSLRIWCCASDPASLDPAAANGSDEISILSGIQRGLLYFDKDLNLVPMLAEALPTVSSDGLTYTYKLKDAKYSNGDPIVAGDIVRAAQRLADPRLKNVYNYEMCLLKGGKELLGQDNCGGDAPPTPDLKDNAKIDGLIKGLAVAAPDDKTVTFTLNKPTVYFPELTAMWLLTPTPQKQVDQKWAEAKDIIASGPFVIDSWTHNSEFVLKPNPNWYGTKPTLQEIHITMGGDPEAAVASYEQGQLDMVVVPGTSTRRVKEDPTLSQQIKDTPQLSVSYYDFANCQAGAEACPKSKVTADGKSVMANKTLRIAFTEAIDKKQLSELTYGGLLVPGCSSVMPGMPGYDKDYCPYAYNPTKAKEDFAKALTELGIKDNNGDGKVNGKDLGTLKFGYNCNAGHVTRVTFLAEAWRSTFGMDQNQFDVSCTDFAVFRKERVAGNKYDISRNGWSADFPHPDNELRDLFACGAGNNNSHYCNPAFDKALDEAAGTLDAAQSLEKYKAAQRMMVDDAPVLFFGYAVTRNLVQPYVTAVSTSSDHENYGDVFYELIQIGEH